MTQHKQSQAQILIQKTENEKMKNYFPEKFLYCDKVFQKTKVLKQLK